MATKPEPLKLLLTGGGTAGHVTPNIALLEAAKARGWSACYIGEAGGIEEGMIAATGTPFFGIKSGKLRRYFAWRNFTDPFLVLYGFLQALAICWRQRPQAVFSKGGYVALPVVAAAWLLRIPVVCHESDVTPGLATRLSLPFCKQVCTAFPQTAAHLPKAKSVLTGTPLRAAITAATRQQGLQEFGLDGNKPILLVFGGSLGAATINAQLRQALDALLPSFDILHITGKGNLAPDAAGPGYQQREFLADNFGQALAAADLVVSRAGANALYELLALRKPHLLIPLPAKASRGDQLANAKVFKEAGFSRVLREEELTPETLAAAIHQLHQDRAQLKARLSAFPQPQSAQQILDLLESHATR